MNFHKAYTKLKYSNQHDIWKVSTREVKNENK